MRPAGVANSGGTPAGIVVRGGLPALVADAVRRLLPGPAGHAVVLVRLSPPTPVSAAVVHAVVDVLVEAGCEVAVGSMLASRDRDRGHHSVGALAHAAGLTGRTERGRPYAVIDLRDDLVLAPLPPTCAIADQLVSRAWLDAATRVVIGRAVTDLADTYAGCLDTLLRVLPEVAGCEPADVAVDVARHLAPQLSVIDAVATSAGADGSRILDPQSTETVVVATDPLLADAALASLLSIDRSASSLVERAVDALGPPLGDLEGDLTAFTDVGHAHPLATRATRRFDRDPRLARVRSAATGGPDDGSAPADPFLAALRPLVSGAVRAGSDPVGQAGLVGLLGTVATLTDGGRAWTTVLDKAKVDRRVVPLGFDPAEHPDAEYDDLPTRLSAIDAIVATLPRPADPEALRWCLVDGSTVFEVTRLVPADFDAWVDRVDVAAGISLMADYIGGRRVPVGEEWSAAEGLLTPQAGTRLRQAERNLYLPQPNYTAVWGGEPIDVCKIELVERDPDRHRLSWRTVRSPNGSAVHDDGILTFERVPAGSGAPGRATGGTTRVSIRGRQLFSLPAVLDAADLPALPEVHGPLLEEAYRRFFATTFDNFEACFEGRDFRIGRPAPDPDEPLLTETLRLLYDALLSRLGGDGGQGGDGWSSPRRHPAGHDDDDGEHGVDAHGFRHVRGGR